MNEWMNEWINEWMNGWMNKMKKSINHCRKATKYKKLCSYLFKLLKSSTCL